MNAFARTLYGSAPELMEVVRSAEIVAATDVTVLIAGESGTGKELVARAIHAESPRARGPLVSINCSAMPGELAESLLFGHRRGAFTGAVCDQQGQVSAAHGGTLFLDEVGELPLPVQGKLLRFIEAGECQPVGETRAAAVDVRLLAATNRDLEAEVRAGTFREDLYYRLNVVPLVVPALRQRRDDVPRLIERLTADLAAQHGLEPPVYTRDALSRLRSYHWPGNVRELRNLCERMLVLFSGRSVHAGNLPAAIRGERSTGGTGFKLPAGGLSLDELEADLIRQALQQAGGNRSRAARLLGLTRDTLLYRIRKYAIG